MKSRSFLFALPLVAAAMMATGMPASAQIQGSEAGLSLSENLMVLAGDPRDVRALVGAGRAALALGDPEAAMGFFQRAEAVDPRSGPAKAGIGTVLLAQEKAADALKQFDAAVRLGVPEAEIARDRGLAYDLRGDPRRAQRDYALAVKRGGDDEAVRRYALSLGISGDRDQALKMLDPLLLKQDRAAWRARAFVLAMNGDVGPAYDIIAVMMPSAAQPMRPFFQRLHGLSSSQRAAAVHLGYMPTDGRADGRINDTLDRDTRIAANSGVLIPAGDPLAPLRAETAPEPVKMASVAPVVAKDPRRRPGQVETKPKTVVAMTAPKPTPKPATIKPAPSQPTPVKVATVIQPITPAPTPAAVKSDDVTLQQIVAGLKAEPVATVKLPEPAPVRAVEVVKAPAPKPAVVVPAKPKPEAAKPVEKPKPDAKTAAKPGDKKADDKKAVAKVDPKKKPEPKKPDPAKLHPARIWAQIATGANAKALATDFGKFAKKSPEAFKGMQGWSVPFRGTRRLLVGPFPTSKKAQDFLKKAEITGFPFESPAGMEIEKLSGK